MNQQEKGPAVKVRDLRIYEEAILERICSVCIDLRDDGSCGIDPKLECSVKEHLPEIIGVVQGVNSNLIGDYVERLRQNVCKICESPEPDGTCEVRARTDCALNRYFNLVVEAIEEVEQRKDGSTMAEAP